MNYVFPKIMFPLFKLLVSGVSLQTTPFFGHRKVPIWSLVVLEDLKALRRDSSPGSSGSPGVSGTSFGT